jgi:hypothetical protein
MALEAKDFHLQAQWALVAIPAPIYFQPACTLSAARDFSNQMFTAMRQTASV